MKYCPVILPGQVARSIHLVSDRNRSCMTLPIVGSPVFLEWQLLLSWQSSLS